MSTSGPEPERQAKFAQTITKALQKACQTYLKESGLDENSEDWKRILATEDPQQVVDVINATWAQRNTQGDTHNDGTHKDSTPEDDTHRMPSSAPKSTKRDYKAVTKRIFNRAIGRKESGHILRHPADISTPNVSTQSYIDTRSDLKQKLSRNPPKGKAVVDHGAALTDAIAGASESDILKTVVDAVEKFSGALQNLVNISQVVRFPVSSAF